MARPTIQLMVGMGANPTAGIDVASSSALGRSVLKSVTTTRGRQRTLDVVQPGTLTALFDNQLREFDPFATTGPFTTGGVSQLRPGPWIQLSAQVGTPTTPSMATLSGDTIVTLSGDTLGTLGTPTNSYYIWSGFLTTLPVTWGVGQASQATWTATEALVALSRVNPVALAAAVGDSELSGARIHRILTNASWPLATSVFPPFGASRVIDTGVVSLQSTLLGTNALSEAQTVTTTERGDFFSNGAGQAVYRNRGYRFLQRNGTTNATFGDGGGSEIPYVEGTLVIGNNSDLYRNTAHIGGPGLVTQTSTVAGPYVSDYSQTSLPLRSRAEALSYANWITATYSAGDLRIDSFQVQPTDDDTNWPTLLALEPGMWVTVNVRPPGSNGGVITRECFIEGVSHTIPPEGEGPWTITYRLGDASAYAGPWFVLNDPTYGRLDQGNKLVF